MKTSVKMFILTLMVIPLSQLLGWVVYTNDDQLPSSDLSALNSPNISGHFASPSINMTSNSGEWFFYRNAQYYSGGSWHTTISDVYYGYSAEINWASTDDRVVDALYSSIGVDDFAPNGYAWTELQLNAQ